MHVQRLVTEHQDTDDVIQNTFIKIWKYLATYKGDSQLYTWLYRIAINESLTFLKQRTRHRTHALEDVTPTALISLQSEDSLTPEAINLKLEKAIALLPQKQQSVFILRYFDNLPYEEISTRTGTSVGALKASFHHAAKKIESYLTA